MPRAAKGHIEQLPSGSFRVSVYGGIDPLTRQEIRLRSTVKDELQAQIELGRLLKEASEGRTPETGATVARLMDEYAPIAEWDVSTRQTNEGFIRRTIKPALGHLKVRKVRGPVLDQLYTRLKRCGDNRWRCGHYRVAQQVILAAAVASSSGRWPGAIALPARGSPKCPTGPVTRVARGRYQDLRCRHQTGKGPSLRVTDLTAAAR